VAVEVVVVVVAAAAAVAVVVITVVVIVIVLFPSLFLSRGLLIAKDGEKSINLKQKEGKNKIND